MRKKRMADGLITGLEQAVKMERGTLVGRSRERSLSRPAPNWSKREIQQLRKEVFQMSQPIFASLLNIKPATVRAWEQGHRTPDGAAARLLEVLSNNTTLVQKIAS